VALAILDRILGKGAVGKARAPAPAAVPGVRPTIAGAAKVAPEPTWGWKDNGPRPQGYILGVTPGATWTFYQPGGEYRGGLGLDRKIELASRMGFPFAMIDIETVTEFLEENLADRVEAIKEARNMEVGVHYPWEIELTDAKATLWRYWHKVLVMCTKGTADIMKAKFGLIHLSYEVRPDFIKRLGAEDHLLSPYGENLGDWVEKETPKLKEINPDFDFKDWFMSIVARELMRGVHVSGEFLDSLRDRQSMKKFEEEQKKKIEEIKDLAKPVVRRKIKEIEDQASFAKEENLRRIKREIDDREAEIKKLADQARGLPPNSAERIRMAQAASQLEQEMRQLEQTAQQIQTSPAISMLPKEMQEQLEIYRSDAHALDLPGILNEHFRAIARHLPEAQNDAFAKTYRFLEEAERIRGEWDHWRRIGAIATEIDAYHAVAKWMWIKKDKMYVSIVGDKDPDEIIKNAQEKAAVTPELDKLVVAVAGKYIEGHLKTEARPEFMVPEGPMENINKLERDPEGFKEKNVAPLHTVYDYHKKNNVLIYLENFMPPGKFGGGDKRLLAVGEVRIYRTVDALRVCLAIDNGEWVNYVPDIEHILLHGLDPVKEAEEVIKAGLPGNIITSMHINPPRPYSGLHAVIQPISNDVLTLFRIFRKFREAGMKDAILIWERGSEGPPKQSAEALRTIVKFLAADFDVEDLPDEFYGLGDQFRAAQEVAIREKALAPVEGLLTFPEEEWTLLSSAAREKQKLDVWARERLK